MKRNLVVVCLQFGIILAGNPFKLNIIHVNDIHVHFEEVNSQLGRCHQKEKENHLCYGGAARLYSKVAELRKNNSGHTLLLNAGDYFEGTIWYTILKYEPIVVLANMLNYTAFSLGNHDFDDGVEGLVPFLQQVNFPVLSANIKVSKDSPLKTLIKPSVIKDFDGIKVGIIGYISPRTAIISQPGPNITFHDEIYTVNQEAKKLKDQGVNIIIALGHSGYNFDKILASQAPDIDLVVGGHSHSFLYTGKNPPDEPEGDYPTYVTQNSGRIIPVVQAGSYSKYVGYLELLMDENGEILQPIREIGVKNAKPILLDFNVPKSSEVLKAMEPFLEKLKPYKELVGNTTTDLTTISQQECILGNVVTDAFRSFPWNDIDISFINTGSLRSVLTHGNITLEDIYSVLPFNNSLNKVELKGKDIKTILSDKLGIEKNILQVSGAKIHYRKDYHSGKWILDNVLVPCKENATNKNPTEHTTHSEWCDIQDERSYKIAITSYLTRGGDGWKFPNYFKIIENGTQSVNSLKNYIQNNSPIKQEIEGRLAFTYDLEPDTINPILAGFCINFVMVLTFLAGLRLCYRQPQPTRLDVPYQRIG